MDTLLCDELLQEIFHRLRPPSLAAVSLVSKRWNRLLRSSTTSLSLYLPPPYDPTTIASFSSFLSQHPFLTNLSVATSPLAGVGDNLLLSVSASCPKLRGLRYLTNPLSPFSLFFSGLKCLSLFFTNPVSELDSYGIEEKIDAFDVEFSVENLSLSGIVSEDRGLGLLWRNCKNIRKLQLQSCASLGDYASVSGFVGILEGLQELELRACRSIVDGVLLKVAEHCVSLDSLLIYDGGSQEGLMQFINHSKCNLKRLELRLPLDLDNSHLIALTENLNFRALASLRLESCCLVTGDGLKVLARTIGMKLEELALINCDVVERESGLLTALGQDLKRLRKLDLSYNETMVDKELTLMLASCNFLIELRLRGCRGLTDKSVSSMISSCKNLQSVDITCCGIQMEGVELLVLKSKRLRQLEVEKSKLSGTSRIISSSKSIEVLCLDR
ncbi:F-box/LRR-repeat protein 4-like [Dorcoceras hygrometricum]|uniref:F-box/LRR-repeat protein 4-like n=1 Tax=Dorcoceras hygrometricum TaxID=472368 RepID=A0A2Z7CH92_9LAMI|nr:F-box/LRR-repeat protein 4-like [Dorcoceras hygrometricum]